MAASTTMRSLCVFTWTEPKHYVINDIPIPKIIKPTQVLIRVHAASLNPTDVHGAAGAFKYLISVPMPYKIGYDLSGVVVEIGSAVTKWKVGDEVFGQLNFTERGSLSEYAVSDAEILARKPEALSHVEAAAIPLVSLTAIAMLDKVVGGLEGKTVFIPAALSGVGSVLCLLAKNAYGAKKIITTLSTEKIGKLDKMLGPGIVDQIIDYKLTNPLKELPAHSIDVFLDSTKDTHTYISLVKMKGALVSCTGVPGGHNLKEIVPDCSYILYTLLNIVYAVAKWWVERHDVKYGYVLSLPNVPNVERMEKYVRDGKLKGVVGTVVELEDIESVKKVSEGIFKGKNGAGKVVVKIVKNVD